MDSTARTVGVKEVLGSRAFQRWSVPVALARMPPLMAAVAVTTAAAVYLDDPDRGGTMASAFVLGLLLLAPVAASCADRFSTRGVLRWQLIGSCVAWLAVSWAIQAGAPGWSWHLGALAAGACMAGSAGLLRSTLSQAVQHRQLRVASSVDATLLELVIVAAPLVVAAAVLMAPIGATVVVALVSFLGAAAVRLLPEPVSAKAATKTSDRLRLTGPLLAWASAGLAFGLALGAVEIGAVSLVMANGGQANQAWVIYAALALSSAAGGLLDARTAALERGDHRPRVVVLAALMVTGGSIAALAASPVLILAGVALVGFPTAPLLSARSLRTEAVVGSSIRGRAFTLVFAAQSLGFAGAGLLLTELGHRGAITVGSAAILASTLYVIVADKPRSQPCPQSTA